MQIIIGPGSTDQFIICPAISDQHITGARSAHDVIGAAAARHRVIVAFAKQAATLPEKLVAFRVEPPLRAVVRFAWSMPTNARFPELPWKRLLLSRRISSSQACRNKRIISARTGDRAAAMPARDIKCVVRTPPVRSAMLMPLRAKLVPSDRVRLLSSSVKLVSSLEMIVAAPPPPLI